MGFILQSQESLLFPNLPNFSNKSNNQLLHNRISTELLKPKD
jgi:hypothetical protein